MKFCFYGYISCAIKGQTIGGGELQVYFLAKALALKGHDVVIIDPYSSESFVTAEGIKLITVPEWNRGKKGLRFFQYRIPALWKVFTEQDADYYYVRMRSYLHLIPYMAAKKISGKFILAIASDLDIASFFKKFSFEYKSNFNLFKYLTDYFPSDLAFKFLLKKADYVTIQHSGQIVHSAGIANKVVGFSNIIDCSKLIAAADPKGNYFIYVGSLTMLKGAKSLLELVTSLNGRTPVMIVGRPKGRMARMIFEELGRKKNVIVKGQMKHSETIELIKEAKAMINTSYYEGFPNSYLEAWAVGIPVISLNVNPGNIFDKFSLGICCSGDLTKMKYCIENNATEGIDRNGLIAYVKQYHDFNTAAERFISALERA